MRERKITVMLFAACSCVAAGSACTSAEPHRPPPGAAPTREIKRVARQADRDLDLLFLVDDSPSMRDKQLSLASAAPAFVAALGALPGGLPNVHLGVVTSDLGTKGSLDAAPGTQVGTIGNGGCRGTGDAGELQLFSVPVTSGRFLSDVAAADGTRVRNFTGALGDTFGQIVRNANAAGCGFEQPLEAIKQALLPGNAANAGFLRPDAVLGIVILTDEDDCSLAHSTLLTGSTSTLGPLASFRCTRFGIVCDQGGQTPDAMDQVGSKGGCHPDDASPYLTRVGEYVQFLSQLKADPAKLVVSAIAGPAEPVATELRVLPGSTTRIPQLAHSCSYLGSDGNGDGVPDVAVADPPVRIKALVDQLAGRSALSSICQQDLSGALAQVSTLLRTGLGDPCFAGKLATSGPSGEPDCEVSVIGVDGAATALPRCASGSAGSGPACWRPVVDAAACPAGDHVFVAIEGQAQLPGGARVTAGCALAPAS